MRTPGEYEWLKSMHICVNCRKEKAARGHVLCAQCLDDKRHKGQNDYANMTEEQKAQNKADKKAYHEKLIAERRCVRCTKPLASWEEYKTCGRCRAKMRRYCQNYREDRGVINATMRNSFEYCSICSKPIDKSEKKKICDRCRENCLRNLEKARQSRNDRYFRGLNNIFWTEKRRKNEKTNN